MVPGVAYLGGGKFMLLGGVAAADGNKVRDMWHYDDGEKRLKRLGNKLKVGLSFGGSFVALGCKEV